MNLVLVGTNHKISPIEIREKLSLSQGGLKEALFRLADYPEIKGIVIISTCNRVEFYATVQDIEAGIKALKDFISKYNCPPLSNLEPYLYTYIGKSAVRHLFRVLCGLDSQIVGELQILEQVRSAWQQAKAIEVTDAFLNMLFERAVKLSLKVRQETDISRGKISIGSIVLELIKTKYNYLSDKKILIIGVGKISELVVKYLKKEKPKAVFISNRTYEGALELAGHIGAQVLRFDRLKEKLNDTDIIISATSSPHLILKKEDLAEIKKPLLIIDLAVPRDVEPGIKYIEGINLFTLDDLDFIIEKNLHKRKEAMPEAEELIEKEVENLYLTEPLAFWPTSNIDYVKIH